MSGLLRVEGLVKYFPIRSGISGKVVGWVKAVDGVDLAVPMNSVVALVGESGCGKSTTARCVLRLYKPTSGRIPFMGKEVSKLKGKELKEYRRNV